MSKESIEFVEMARQAAAAQRQRKEKASVPYSFYCPSCMHQRFFEFSNEDGSKEYYRCTHPGCGRIIDFTVR